MDLKLFIRGWLLYFVFQRGCFLQVQTEHLAMKSVEVHVGPSLNVSYFEKRSIEIL